MDASKARLLRDASPMNQQLPLLTLPEAALLLKVSDRHLERLIADGRLPAVRIGHSVRIDPDQLRAFIVSGGTAKSQEKVLL